MQAINSFKDLFLEVWNEGVFVKNDDELLEKLSKVLKEDYLLQGS